MRFRVFKSAVCLALVLLGLSLPAAPLPDRLAFLGGLEAGATSVALRGFPCAFYDDTHGGTYCLIPPTATHKHITVRVEAGEITSVALLLDDTLRLGDLVPRLGRPVRRTRTAVCWDGAYALTSNADAQFASLFLPVRLLVLSESACPA